VEMDLPHTEVLHSGLLTAFVHLFVILLLARSRSIRIHTYSKLYELVLNTRYEINILMGNEYCHSYSDTNRWTARMLHAGFQCNHVQICVQFVNRSRSRATRPHKLHFEVVL
jgi:hypothetical protein